jgi:acyl dehydratase
MNIASPQSSKLYLDDLMPGLVFKSYRLTVDSTAIKAFASQFDPQPFHLDEEAAAKTFFGGLAASGWHTAALTMRLLVEGGLPIAGGIVGAGVEEMRWTKPVRPGDTLRVETEVLETRPSRSRPDQGLAKIRSTTFNQNGEAVQVMRSNLVVPRRPA